MNRNEIKNVLKQVKFNAHGLVPAVIQDKDDNAVLMVAYMNKRSLRVSLEEGMTCFWSRSRKKLWRKGEQSGNRQKIARIFIDCDGDCILFQVFQKGGAACHTGYRSCFYRHVTGTGRLKAGGKRVFDPAKVYT